MSETGSETGYVEWDRNEGWSDSGVSKINRKPPNPRDLDTETPIDEIGDGGEEGADKPGKDQIDDRDVGITPVKYDIDDHSDDEAAIRDEIIRSGILDNPNGPNEPDEEAKNEIN